MHYPLAYSRVHHILAQIVIKMLNKDALKAVMIAAVQSGPFPACAPILSQAIANYVQSNGTPVAPTMSFTLAPLTGEGWVKLRPIAEASRKGVAEEIIKITMPTETALSTKVIPGPDGPIVVGMHFNTGAKIADLSGDTTFGPAWGKIAEGIIEFFKPEVI